MRTKAVKIELWFDDKLVESKECKTIKRAIDRSGFLLEKFGIENKSYNLESLELAIYKRNCPRVTFLNSDRRFFLTIEKLTK